MKIAVFGATGKIGQNIISQALENGHEITAFARSPDKTGAPHKNLRVVKGDVLDFAAVKTAVKEQDAVICALGMPLFNKDRLRENGTKNIVRAMKELGVKRLVCLSVHGVGDSYSMLPLSYKYLIMPLFFRHILADHKAQEALIKNSDLDWVITRAVNFTKGPFTGDYQHGFSAANKPATLKISQSDLADFMLKQITDDHYLRRTPSIAY